MNVLILTPDRVGSTLLQRLLTIYMLRRGFDKPVINLHELTNGLEKSYSPAFNNQVLHKPQGTDWGYYQSLSDIKSLLESVDHYKTSRLAHYHIQARQDSISDQLDFYNYLNKNFFIISCRRDNVFEHALSWVISSFSKTLNVYFMSAKISHFEDLYKNGITVSEDALISYLNRYKQYISWADTHFDIQSYFNYDRDINNIEQFILSLDFMQGATNNSWKDMFGQEWSDFNTVHRVLPNLAMSQKLNNPSLAIPQLTQTETESEQVMFSGLALRASTQVSKFLNENIDTYKSTTRQIDKLVSDGYLVTGVPVKLQSLAEKRFLIKNFSQCLEWYNKWANKTGFSSELTDSELLQIELSEESILNQPIAHNRQLT